MSRIEEAILNAFADEEWQLRPFNGWGIGITEIMTGCWLKLRLDGTYQISGHKTALRIARRMGHQGKILCEESVFSTLRIAPMEARAFGERTRLFYSRIHLYTLEEAIEELNAIRAANGCLREPIQLGTEEATLVENEIQRAATYHERKVRARDWLTSKGV